MLTLYSQQRHWYQAQQARVRDHQPCQVSTKRTPPGQQYRKHSKDHQHPSEFGQQLQNKALLILVAFSRSWVIWKDICH
jgi:hypothetical protein